MTRINFLLAVFSISIAGVAFAENVVVATCGDGGCDCLLSEMSVEEAELLLGEDAPEGSEPLIVDADGVFDWSRVSSSDLDHVYGGNGNCELAFFPAIEPADGTWQGTAQPRQVSGCPRGVDGAIAPKLSGINETHVMLWENVFHPSKISHGVSTIVWKKINDDHYSGYQPLPAPTPALKVTAVWDSEILDPEYVRSVVDIRLSSSLPQAAMIGLANCRIRAKVDFRRIGP